MASWNVSRPTLLIPYGLKSLLECVCRAIRIEDPQHIQLFIAAYCKDLLEHRDYAPSRDLRKVIHVYQKMREHGQVTKKKWQGSPDAAPVRLPCGEPAEMYQDPFTTESVSRLSCRLAGVLAVSECTVQPFLACPEILDTPSDPPLARVQSAVFQRVPSRCDFPEIHSTVLIDSARAPPADVIIVHSENLPSAIVFHCDSRPSSASSVRSSMTSRTPSLTDVEGTEDWCLGTDSESDSGGMVVFERVPSKEDRLPPQSPVGADCGELQNSETADKPLTLTAQQSTGQVEEHAETLKIAASQEPFKIMKISSKRSLVKVFSAHMVKTEDSVEKADDRSEESDKEMSPIISPVTSVTVIACPVSAEKARNDITVTSDNQCPPEHALDITTTGDIEGPTEHAEDNTTISSIEQASESAAKCDSLPVSSNDLSVELMPLMAGTVDSAVLTAKFKSVVEQLSEECLAEVVGVLDNKESFESLPAVGELTKRDTPPRMYLQTESDGARRKVDESQAVSPHSSHSADISQAVRPMPERVYLACAEEREGTATQEQSVRETLVGAAVAGVSVLPAEYSGRDRTESDEREDVNRLGNSPPHTPEENMVCVMLVKSPIEMNRGELADDADHSHLVKGICEASTDYSEPPPLRQHQPGETLDSVNEHTGLKRTADKEGPNTSNTAFVPCEIVSPQCIVQKGENTTLPQLSVEDSLSTATPESILPGENSGSDNTEREEDTAAQEPSVEESPVHMNTSETVDADHLNLTKEMHQSLADNSDSLLLRTPEESMVFVTPVESPTHLNTSEFADADHLNIVEAILEALADYSEAPPYSQHQPWETSDSVDEHIGLTSATEEDDRNAGNTVSMPREAVSPHYTEQRDENTTAQQPSALNTTTTVELVLQAESLESDNTECLERAENVLQDVVVSMIPVYFGTCTTKSLALEPVDENMHSISPVCSSCENLSEITDTAPDENSVRSNPQCPERTENVFQEDVVSVTATAERVILELTEENVDSTNLVSRSCVDNLSEITETAAAPQTLQTDVSLALSPVTCPEAEESQTASLQLKTVSPHHTGLEREEAAAQQPSGDEAPGILAVVNDETDSSDREGCKLKGGLFEDSKMDKVEIAEIVVPEDIEAFSIRCTGDITEEFPKQPAEGRIDYRGSASGSRQENMSDKTGTVTDEFSLVSGTSDQVDDILEPSPLRQVLSEKRIAVDAPAQISSTTMEHPSGLDATNSSNAASATISSLDDNASISRGTTDNGTYPVMSPRASTVLGFVHASTDASRVNMEETSRDTWRDESPASGSQIPDLPGFGDETTAQPTKNVQTESTQDEEQQEHIPDPVTGPGTCTSPVLKSSVNQVWTLYHLPHSSDEGTLCTHVLSQPPFNGSAYIRAFGPGYVLMAEKSPQPSTHDLRQAPGGAQEGTAQHPDHPVHHQRTQPTPTSAKAATGSVCPSASLPNMDTVEINLPNFLLCIDDRTKQARPLLGSPGGPAQSARVRRDDAAGLLSLSIPSASLQTASGIRSGSGQAQFLQLTSDEGCTLYSPAVLQIATHCTDQSKEK